MPLSFKSSVYYYTLSILRNKGESDRKEEEGMLQWESWIEIKATKVVS